MHWDDPRTQAEKLHDEEYEAKHPRPVPSPPAEGGGDQKKEEAEMKARYTVGKDAKTGETVEIDWKINPLLVGMWRDEPRLIDFETHFYDEGGKPTGKGF